MNSRRAMYGSRQHIGLLASAGLTDVWQPKRMLDVWRVATGD